MRFILYQRDCRTTYLRVETTSESSTMTGEPSTMKADGGTKVEVGGGGEVEVNGS